MNEEQQPAGQRRQARKSAVDIRTLLTRREYIKTTAYLLPRRAKIQLLELMERLRRARWDRHPRPREAERTLPEMTVAEMVREINWRIGTLPPEDAEVVADHLSRVTRWRERRPAARRTVRR